MGFADARAAADRAENVQRSQAARTVADNSVDANDCRELLLMLGLPDPPAGNAPVRTQNERAQDQRAPEQRVPDYSYQDAPDAAYQAGVRE
ncbi:hypothetical protein ALI22I_44000 [Saccharothrix sp. ALI-22-I]|uniref:hypothetical protein n=1 Tax=Saccharothrix sp. ALI-22-I TaxID=1933778 RepID=UPI00097C8369|nr:hypothetical protein [Saccharothrix sp. ALI-22-I]ONI80319.1 hypothetical protein ALI22I_44000 [Saccharothrix sp. ALI-22-I]